MCAVITNFDFKLKIKIIRRLPLWVITSHKNMATTMLVRTKVISGLLRQISPRIVSSSYR